MTSVKIDSRGSHFVIEISGHANYNVPGKDIVCAGISLLSFMLCETVEKETQQITNIMESGYCYFAFATDNEITKAKIDVIASGFRMLSEAYPNYVNLSVTTDEYK